MRRLAILAGLTAALLMPVAAQAGKPAPGGRHAAKPAASTHQNASRICRAERGSTDATRAAFRTKYGANHDGANAFGKCVSAEVRTLRQMDSAQQAAEVNAAKACDAERGKSAKSRAAFAHKYGGRRNAFGRCMAAATTPTGDRGEPS